MLDEDEKNQHITSWSNSQTSSEPQTPSPPGKCRRPNNDIGRELEAFEQSQDRKVKRGSAVNNEFDFRLDDEITREFRPRKSSGKRGDL